MKNIEWIWSQVQNAVGVMIIMKVFDLWLYHFMMQQMHPYILFFLWALRPNLQYDPKTFPNTWKHFFIFRSNNIFMFLGWVNHIHKNICKVIICIGVSRMVRVPQNMVAPCAQVPTYDLDRG